MTAIEATYQEYKQALFDKVYSDLNERQREAVFTTEGPLLVLAGAGSGKTTVLVRRIAFLIRYGNAYFGSRTPAPLTDADLEDLRAALDLPREKIESMVLPTFADDACPPWRVLAITFTNKAANEIKTRLSSAFDDERIAADIWAGTFHSICVKILRASGDRMGYRPGFTIYDTDDQKRALATAMKECNIDEKILPVKSVQSIISRAKDRLFTPDDFEAEVRDGDFRAKKVAAIYHAYQRILRESNALDFDDLIMQTVLLLRRHDDVREAYQRKFRYVSVDEFQDTNPAQLELTRLLAGGARNLMVVGDDDQSIYRFRGATIENILSFDRLYPDAKVVKLEENYRSTPVILDAANAVIDHNEGRHKKTLWTAKAEGEKISFCRVEDQNEEARYIVDTVTRGVARGAKYRDYAVLYRTNAQSNSIERALARAALPYRVLGGTRFSDRKEIRDAVAYLQLINNHDDNLRLLRIINEPRRKIGAKTLEAVAAIAAENGTSQFEVLAHADRYVALERTKDTLMGFASLINDLSERANSLPLDELFSEMLDRTGYRQMLIDGGEPEAERLENLDEFKSGILEYMKDAESPSLTEFLEETALVADVDRYDESADAVVLMTIHSAKGLEFPVVFLPGMEEGLFPGTQTLMGGPAELEEERRLAYVAITRAKQKLYLLAAKYRLLYGHTMANPVSRFVEEIPKSLLDEKKKTTGGAPSRTHVGDHPLPEKKSSSPGVTVGKDLFKKSAPTVAFTPGDRVRHATFGEGLVLSVKKMGADLLYEILFDDVGIKKMMATYAKLQKQ